MSQASESGELVYSSEDELELRNVISQYTMNQNDIAFGEIYDFKQNVDARILESINLNNIKKLLKANEETSGMKFKVNKAPNTGIVAYYVDGMEEKILSLYACGMSQRDIAEQIKNLYDVEISPELISKISEKILPEVTAWQNRPLEAVYPFVFMDAIHYKVKENHQYITKAAYVVLGINLDGQKDILGIWIGENESSKFWLNVLNELKTRGIKDVFLFCVDGLTGFRQAIEAAFPNAQIQRCIIHQIRSSTRFVSYKHIKELMADLKKVYQAISEEEAMNNLILFKDKWGKTYPSCVKSWEENWDILSTFFAYPPEVRKIIYTTNIIEGLNRQFRQITKNKPSFTNDDSLRKMLYLASQKIVERWTQRCRNWDVVLSQLSIIFEDRISA